MRHPRTSACCSPPPPSWQRLPFLHGQNTTATVPPYLIPEQKRDILYNNAARFLRLETGSPAPAP